MNQERHNVVSLPIELPVPGNTPLMDLNGILVKLECVNPTGSIKDRIASYILKESRRRGLLKPGQHIIEATSGNTGIAMAFFGKALGHPVTIVMPENMTDERKERVRSLGADLILCSKEGSFAEAARIRDEQAIRNGWFNPDQFSNPLNTECHVRTTGAELLRQTKGQQIDAFVAGVGTGGTLIGVGKALRAVFPEVKIVAVEPSESAVMTGGPAGPHAIFGIGDGFIPAIAGDGHDGLHPMIDEVSVIASQDAIDTAHRVREEFGTCVGISSGANYLAAERLRDRYQTVATVFSDGYGKYVSYGLCGSEPGACKHEEHCIKRGSLR